MPNGSHQRAQDSANSPHAGAVLPPRDTGKKITRPDTSIPNKPSNMTDKAFQWSQEAHRKSAAKPLGYVTGPQEWSDL